MRFFFFWLEVMDKNWRHDRTALDIDKNQLMRESELEAPRATAAAVFSIEKLLANTTGIIIYYNKKKKKKKAAEEGARWPTSSLSFQLSWRAYGEEETEEEEKEEEEDGEE